MCRVDRHPCIGSIKHKYNSDLNWMKTSINILSPHPVMLKKLWSASGTFCLGTFWPTDLGTFWPYIFWFGDVLTGHPKFHVRFIPKFCITEGPVTRTVGILTDWPSWLNSLAVNGASHPTDTCCRLVLCPRKNSGTGNSKLALWLCPQIFPMCYQTAGGLTQYLDQADSADVVFTHTVYE